ncbi:MAG: efflux transporter outer membrane subunit [Pseudomonadota bacterium]
MSRPTHRTAPCALGPTTALAWVLLCALSGCAIGPTHERPSAPVPATYKEAAPGWVPATPADGLERGAWWAVFNDPLLDELQRRVDVSNQNIAAASAAYAQARALVGEQRAAAWPIVSLDTTANRSGGESSSSRGSGLERAGLTGANANRYQVSLGASWEPDVWGRLRQSAEAAQAGAQASAADLAAARLAAQGELAVNYLGVRQLDAQRDLLQATIGGYERTLQIARNRYDAGVAPKTDVLQAQTQLANAQADRLGLIRQRAQLEHAIAVLLGQAPADFTLAPTPWASHIPTVPVGLPSTLLQRRPDIASAERQVALANAQIGIARSAHYPSFGLSASVGAGATRVSELFNAPTTLWSLGLQAAQTLFDAGATRERVAGAQATRDQAVARYRQTVLVAFQGVEDQLAAARVLEAQQTLRRQATDAAEQVEAQALNRYRAGQVGYTEVVTAQATALNARRALIQAVADRQTTVVALIQALGGGWQENPL